LLSLRAKREIFLRLKKPAGLALNRYSADTSIDTACARKETCKNMNIKSLGITIEWQRIWMTLLLVVGLTTLAGCAASEPVPAPMPSTFDRAWSAALSAAQDEGVRIVSEDRQSGIIRGSRDPQEVTILLRSQADGSVRVEISSRGPKGSDPGLAGRISRAYDRRMGR